MPDQTSVTSSVKIFPWIGIAEPRPIDDVLEIFFESSATTTFASQAARQEFSQKWLLRYLHELPQSCFAAITASGRCAGYLAGAFATPLGPGLFADHDHLAAFREEISRAPAHLHINVRSDWRGRGLGARLVEAFIDACRVRQICGVHVLTGLGQRNNTFYRRCGFKEIATRDFGGRSLCLLQRLL